MRRSIATVSLSGTLAEKLSAAAAAGFDGVELFENDLIACPFGPKEIRRRADDLGLTIDLYQPFRDAEALPAELYAKVLRRADHVFEVMEQLGAPTLLSCSNVSDQAVDDDALAADQLRTLAERAAGHGLTIAYEALAWGRHVNDYAHSWRIVQAADHPALGICLDSFHILTRDTDPAGIRDIPGDKIFYLQLADAPGLRMDTLHFSRHYRCFPGQGVFDLTGFLEHVLAAGYQGPLSLEIFNDVFRRSDAERTAVDAMRSLIVLGETLPGPSRPHGYAFTEITVDALSEQTATDMLSRMGFTRTGAHHSKPVHLWEQGEARILLNRTHPGTWQRAAAAVTVLGVDDPDPQTSGARARALLAPPAPRAIAPGEASLPAVIAPDETAVFFCRPGDWLADFTRIAADGALLTGIDHVSLSPRADRLDETLLFFETALGLRLSSDEEIADPYGLLRSKAVTHDDFRLVFNVPIGDQPDNENGQHIAFGCADIFATAAAFADREVPTLAIPQNYYDHLAARTDLEPAAVRRLGEHGILYDRGADGEYFHFYVKALSPGLFFEIVQRTGGYDGFGAPNAPVRRAMQAR